MSASVARNRWRLAVRLIAAALIWSLGLVLTAVLLPTSGGQTIVNSQGVTLTARTLVQVDGPRVLIILAVPVVVSLIVGLALHRRRVTGWRWSRAVAWTAIAVLVAVTVLLGILSVGAFMIPVVIALALAVRLVVKPQALRSEGSRPRPAGVGERAPGPRPT